jgi:fructose/tagatose bisphosphate aldolase
MTTTSPGGRTLEQVLDAFRGSAAGNGGAPWRLGEPSLFRGAAWDDLAWFSVFAPDGPAREAVRAFVRGAALSTGAYPASIQPLYASMGRGELTGFTVPAINVRGLTYDTARTIFRAAMAGDVGPVIFEIARSEMAYTEQRPAEYATLVLAAAVREGYRGPVFLQGDHFQVKAAAHREEPEREVGALRVLIREALEAGFYNIDIDASTLVELERPSLDEQQRLNYETTAGLTRVVREREPEGLTVSLGGEIGEVGGQNSTPDELRAFMDGYLRTIQGGAEGISKISVQTGTSHGGVPLPDGRIAEAKLDLETLGELSRIAREEYGMAGAVQHGASTLPDEAFHNFPAKGCAEIHLATAFQNMVYDSALFPPELRAEMESLVEERFAGERKEGQTREQFLYKTRKKAFGPLKGRLWGMPAEVRDGIMAELEGRFAFLFEKLAATGTGAAVRSLVPPHPALHVPGEVPGPFLAEQGRRGES